jgi:hypothetical protein
LVTGASGGFRRFFASRAEIIGADEGSGGNCGAISADLGASLAGVPLAGAALAGAPLAGIAGDR